jgi:hypothetical protein
MPQDKLSPEEEKELAELEAMETEADLLTPEEEQELLQLEALEAEQSTTASEAAIRGAAQGISLGFSDEITSAAESVFGDVTYEQALKENRALLATAKEEHPAAFTAGEIGGGLLIPGAGSVKAAANAPKLIRAGIALGKTAAFGSIDALGKSEEDNLEGQLSDALYGAGAAVTGEALFKGAGKVAGKAGKALKEEAQGLAERSMGVFNPSSRKAFRKNLEAKNISPEEFTERVFSLKNAKGEPLLSGFKSQQVVLDESKERMSQLGDEMGEIVKEVEARSGEIKIENAAMAEHIMQRLKSKYQSDPTLVNQAREAQAIINRFEIKKEMPNETLSDLIYWKNSLLDDFSKNADRPFFKASDVERDAIREISNYVEMKVSSASQDGDLIRAFKDRKAEFGTLAEYGKHVQKAVDADEKGMLGKIYKTIGWAPLAIGGAGIAGAPGALAGIALGTALKTAAKSPTLQRKASKAAMSVGTHLEKGMNPEFAARLSSSATRSMDDFLAELDVLELKTQGFITDPGEAEQLTQQVKGSRAPVREKMRMMGEINGGRVPTPPTSEESSPFMKVYKQRPRDGRKKSEL